MSATAILVFCAQALLVQSAFSQCTTRAAVDASAITGPYGWTGPGVAYDGLAAPAMAYDGLGWTGRSLGCEGIYPAISSTMEFTPTSGGGLAVTSSSAIPPTGISVVSENAYEGALSLAGEVPFVGTVGLEGVLPTAGAGAINHDCGNGVTAMASESTAFPGAAITPATAIGLTAGVAPLSGTIAPVAANFAPAAISRAGSLAPGAGLGLGNRFGLRGCGARGVMY